jgi:transcriptional regulator with XRE-family HTH domain
VEDPEVLVLKVGRRIAELRQLAGLTQEELAEQLGVGWRYLSRAERGENLTLRTMAKIANVFGVEVRSLLKKPRSMNVSKPGRPKKR